MGSQAMPRLPFSSTSKRALGGKNLNRRVGAEEAIHFRPDDKSPWAAGREQSRRSERAGTRNELPCDRTHG